MIFQVRFNPECFLYRLKREKTLWEQKRNV